MQRVLQPELSAASFSAIVALVSARTGILVGPAVRDHVARASRRTMQRLAIEDERDLLARLERDPSCFDELIDEVSVGETYFFRDSSHFDLVRSTVLPAFLVSGAPELRVWSAGCASGEEAYSLAMLLADMGLLERSFLLATDISQRALRAARAGRYRDWSLRGDRAQAALPYLRAESGAQVVSESLRAAVHFAALNLADDGYPSRATDTTAMHLIFCRNVLMYFHPAAVDAVERRLFAALAPGGYLFLGPSDPILGSAAPFEVMITPHGGLCYRKPALAPKQAFSVPAQPAPERQFERPPAYEFELDLEREHVREPEAAAARVPPLHEELLATARAASERADYARVIELATAAPEDAELAALHVRALWNLLGASAALALCSNLLARHGLRAELHYLHALILLEQGRDRDAVSALRRTLYLDRSLTIAHFTLGSVCARSGELEAARAAYRNAEAGCSELAIDAEIALGDGIRAGGLGLAAARAREALGSP